MAEVAQNGAKIVPRLIFEKFHPSQLIKMLKQEVLLKSIAKTMADLTVKHGLDGLTIEIWNSIRNKGSILGTIILRITVKVTL